MTTRSRLIRQICRGSCAAVAELPRRGRRGGARRRFRDVVRFYCTP